MEKTTLRIILIIAGLVLVLGIYFWDRWKRSKEQLDKTLDEMNFDRQEDDFELEEIDTIAINPMEESVPMETEVLEAELRNQSPPELEDKPAPPAPEPEPHPRPPLPEVIQVSIAAPDQQTFQGFTLLKAFHDLGLKHGDMDIFHYYLGDKIQFSVASLVKPGTFPLQDMEHFQTPGITLFMQPPLVSDPEQILDRMINVSHALAQRLGGKELDDCRQPLTAAKISAWRRQLREAR